jgi:Calcineurin-like phosphoesterase
MVFTGSAERKRIEEIRAFLRADDILVVPDLHGTLKATLAVDVLLQFSNRVIQLGDMIDVRAPGCSSLLALEEMRRLSAGKSDAIFLRGNHEREFIGLMDSLPFAIPIESPDPDAITAIEECWAFFNSVPEVIRSQMLGLSEVYETAHLRFEHGDEIVFHHLAANGLRLADRMPVKEERGGKKTVIGHSLTEGIPVETDNLIYCETGGWLPGRNLCISVLSDDPGDRRLRGWIEISREKFSLKVR